MNQLIQYRSEAGDPNAETLLSIIDPNCGPILLIFFDKIDLGVSVLTTEIY